MSDDVSKGSRFTDRKFNHITQIMTTFDGPGSGDKDMKRYKAARTSETCSKGVKLDTMSFIIAQNAVDFCTIDRR